MLTLTQNATLIVKEIADQQGGAAGSGLRISAEPGPEVGLNVTTAETAEPGDQVLEKDGATVYLDENAASSSSTGVKSGSSPEPIGSTPPRPLVAL